MSCKKGGLVTLWQNERRELTATLLLDVCKDVELEPSILTLKGEKQKIGTTWHLC